MWSSEQNPSLINRVLSLVQAVSITLEQTEPSRYGDLKGDYFVLHYKLRNNKQKIGCLSPLESNNQTHVKNWENKFYYIILVVNIIHIYTFKLLKIS